MSHCKDQDLILAGDGRCDSPGSSAKFCYYSLMEIEKNKIVHMEIVDKREVQLQFPNMEREALKRSLDYLCAHVSIKELVTNASTSVSKTLGKHSVISVLKCSLFTTIATKYPNILHSLDISTKLKKPNKALVEVQH